MSTMQYHQMLASPAVGGGARLALELHMNVTSIRGPVSQLLLPAAGDAERMARTAGHAFAKYKRDQWCEVAEASLAHVRAIQGIDRFCRRLLKSYDALVEARWRRQ